MRAARLRLVPRGWAVRIGVWLGGGLPLHLHRQPLPALLNALALGAHPSPCPSLQERDMAVRVAVRLCRWRCFRGQRFVRLCVRQSLTHYYVLARLGAPVAINVGVAKAGETLRGHRWATVRGEPLAERAPPDEAFRIIDSGAAERTAAAGERVGVGCSGSEGEDI